MRDPVIQGAIDAEHLRLLEIALYIAGGCTALFSCFFLIHFVKFLVFGLNPQIFAHAAHGQNASPPPPGLFLGFAAVIGVVILLGWTFGALQIYAGRCLKQRRGWTFLFVIAILECLFIPWGTVIGICIILVLSRPSVRPLFH